MNNQQYICDLSRFKVVHGDTVLNAVALCGVEFYESTPDIKFITILAINSDGHLEIIEDEAWTFQFIPHITEPRR